MTDKTTAALKLAEEALVGFTTSFRTPVDDVLVAIREALAEQEQEPVAWMHNLRNNLVYSDEEMKTYPYSERQFFTPLYAAPVSAEAIRAEALEEAAKWFEIRPGREMFGDEVAAAIRSLK